mmetsp:Transcript_7705/g.22561  ORF Transcript_7705/g.22561 Transcript_7705/m.22561 type:complete len:223 (+) Transcript_7705:328-996(+)
MLLETNHGQWETKEVRESNGSIRDRDMGNLFGTARQGKARQGKARQENRETPPFFLLGWMTSIPSKLSQTDPSRAWSALLLSLSLSVCLCMSRDAVSLRSDRIHSESSRRSNDGWFLDRKARERNGAQRNGTQRNAANPASHHKSQRTLPLPLILLHSTFLYCAPIRCSASNHPTRQQGKSQSRKATGSSPSAMKHAFYSRWAVASTRLLDILLHTAILHLF